MDEDLEGESESTNDSEITDGVSIEGNKWRESSEYMVSGWFKWVPPKTVKECHALFRLTNNEKSYRTD